jgi:cation diffusion facilitator CzcD-associated flavoprotein CzcO
MTSSTAATAVSSTAGTVAASDAPRHVSVLIVGSGFAGLGAAIRLAKAGRNDYVVIERGSEVGGTWRDNTYPGAACDVPSHLYSFSFALNPNWSRSFSPQAEIQAYIRRTAEESGTLDHHVFDCEMLAAHWDAEAGQWVVETTKGRYTAKILVTAFGALCEPSLPDIKGIESFAGEIFHSSRWNHDYDLTGKRVAVIGTGASSIQLVPQIARQVSHLDVYQRTAPWILPRHDRAYSAAERFAFKHVPGFQRLSRDLIYLGREITAVGFCYEPRLLRLMSKQATAHLRKQVNDPVLRAAVTPNFEMGCKRVLISNDYYPALTQYNVDLITDGIAEVRPNAIVTTDGTVREVDALVVATGFHVTDSPAAGLIKGADGRTLGEQFREFGHQAYKGTAAAGFPNTFALVGPNTGLGHTSMVYMIESQLNYLLDALDVIDRNDLATVEVRRGVQAEFNATLQKRMKRTVWTTGGCASWYLDAHGRNTTLWPGFTFRFRKITRRFDLGAYTSTTHADLSTEPAREEPR